MIDRLWAWLARTFPDVYLAVMFHALGILDESIQRMESDDRIRRS